MSAYNTLGPCLIECPRCGTQSDQTLVFHVAGDFGGDKTGRFTARGYKLGDQLAWYPSTDPRYAKWREAYPPDLVDFPDQNAAEEQCYAVCPSCKATLDVNVRFESLIICNIISVIQAQEPD